MNIRFCTPPDYFAKRPTVYDACYETLESLLNDRAEREVLESTETTYPWDEHSIQRVESLVTGNILTCSAGGVIGPRGLLSFHFVPLPHNIEALSIQKIRHWETESPLDQAFHQGFSGIFPQDRLKNHFSLGSALIIGGDASHAEHRENSQQLFQALYYYLTEYWKISVSYLWGQALAQDPRGIEAFFDSSKNTWSILKYQPNSDEAVTRLDDIMNTFQAVRIDPGSTLFTSDFSAGVSGSILLKDNYYFCDLRDPKGCASLSQTAI